MVESFSSAFDLLIQYLLDSDTPHVLFVMSGLLRVSSVKSRRRNRTVRV